MAQPCEPAARAEMMHHRYATTLIPVEQVQQSVKGGEK